MTDQQDTQVAVVEDVETPAPLEDHNAVSIPVPLTPELQKMRARAAMLEVAFKMAQSLSKTTAVPLRYQQSFVPKGEREPQGIKAAHNLAAAILYGSELGLNELQSAQNVFDVHGQPAVYARTMVAQVRQWIDKRVAQGLASNDPDTGDAIWEVSASPTRVVWAARRAGKTASSEWTPQRAETAGFTKNEKYQKQPIEMLRAKAMTEVCRILFQDVLLGMAYSVEELQLEQGVSVQVVRPATNQKGVGGLEAILAARKQPAITTVVESQPEPVRQHPAEPLPADQSVEQAPLPEPQPTGAIVVDPECVVEPEPELISKRQVTDVKRLLAKETFTNPKAPETLAYVAQMVALEELPSLEALTAAQADAVIAELSK
ncbi:hypothetical protein ACFV6Y_38460 [Streptomyces massasporeus]|uniref:hypothetical protein n=1 Tax=Streptomyces massasporeus TaxID=67324 RepID=UPI00364CB90F